jgi:protein-S-isoprenylcysteine O-methyltransferase Ste14
MALLRPAGTVLVAGSFLLLLFACVRAFRQTGAPDALGMVIVNAVFAFLYVTRSSPKSVSVSPSEWALSCAGTTMSLLLRPSLGGPENVGLTLELAGLALIVAALLSLNRSFGVVPANRGVREGGLYRFVRHPLYAGEIVFITGFMLVNLSAWNVIVWATACVLQVCRARVEERFLNADPQYRSYCERTRYRLLPLVF